MKKRFILVLIGLNLYAQASQACYPDVSDWVPGETLLECASKLILHISVHKEIQFNGKTYFVDFGDNKSSIDHFLFGIPSIKKALEDETLHFDREGNAYTLSNFKGHRITFKIMTDKDDISVTSCLETSECQSQVLAVILQDGKDEVEKALAYKAYFASAHADSKVINLILWEVEGFSIWNKIDVYEACLGCAAMSEEQVLKVLKEAEKFDNDYDRAPVYVAYMKRSDAQQKTMADILEDAKSFESQWNTSVVYAAYLKCKTIDFAQFTSIIVGVICYFDQASRVQVYIAYLEREDADSDTAFMMLKEAENDFTEEHKAQIYGAYIKRKDVKLWETISLLLKTQDFKGEGNITSVYEAYLGREYLHPEIVGVIIDDAQYFAEGHKAPLYAAYVGREEADLEMIGLMLNAAQNFEDGWYTNLIYEAYMQRKNPHPKVIEHYRMGELGIQL